MRNDTPGIYIRVDPTSGDDRLFQIERNTVIFVDSDRNRFEIQLRAEGLRISSVDASLSVEPHADNVATVKARK